MNGSYVRGNHRTLSPTVFLPRAISIEPEAIAVHHCTSDGVKIQRTYEEFGRRVVGLAYYLRKFGHLRVGILCPNTPAYLEIIFAAALAGGVHVGVNYRLKSDDVAYIFEHAQVDLIICDTAFSPQLSKYKDQHPETPILVDTDAVSSPGPYSEAIAEGIQFDIEIGARGWDGLDVEALHEDDPIALAYTSGTTAKPKGAIYTHRTSYLNAMAYIVDSHLNVEGGRCKFLWTLPMFHCVGISTQRGYNTSLYLADVVDSGWCFPWAVTAVRGVHYCLRKMDYPTIWRLLHEEQITHFNAAPTVNIMLCNAREARPLPHPVHVTIGGSPPPRKLFEQMRAVNLHPTHIYGMTETCGPSLKSYPSLGNISDTERVYRLERQGHGVVNGVQHRVIRTDVSEGIIVDVARNGTEVGEIVFKEGSFCTWGYYNDPAATQKLYAGGYLHTGDLAVWHADGSCQVVDRAKDVIISGGENISSVALEAMLSEHPNIIEVAVVAIPDEKWGERPKAYVVLHDNQDDLTGATILEWARYESKISGFMIPKEVEIVKEIPKTATGKVRKIVLRQWAKGLKEADPSSLVHKLLA